MAQLDFIKQKLESRRKELEIRVVSINDDISHKKEPLSRDWSEQAIERENDEVLEALGNSSQIELRQINLALKRMEAGIYQTCERCGEEIPLKRLELVPHTVNCTQCAQALETQ